MVDPPAAEEALRQEITALQATVDDLSDALGRGEEERNALAAALQSALGASRTPGDRAGAAGARRPAATVAVPASRHVTRSVSPVPRRGHADPHGGPHGATPGLPLRRSPSAVAAATAEIVRCGWRYTYKSDRGAWAASADAERAVRAEAGLRNALAALDAASREAQRLATEHGHAVRVLQARVAAAESVAAMQRERATRLEAELAASARRYSDATQLLARREAQRHRTSNAGLAVE